MNPRTSTNPGWPATWVNRWRSPAQKALALLALSLPLASSALADDLVRITAVNGDYDPNHNSVVDVRPGDTVQLSADLFSNSFSGGEYQAQNRFIEEFRWTSDQSTGDECDASQQSECLGQTNFEVTDYGVSYYVPYDMRSEIQITVHHRDSWASDVVVLRNSAQYDNGGYEPPTDVVSEPEQYNYRDLRPDSALAGHGRWVTVSGTRYFTPYAYRADWVPYQNGRWVWTDDGWTWSSYDPWGWYTDHYGTWRHHGVYGWIWSAFDRPVYRPHTVTWVHGDGYLGWYPYDDNSRGGYRHGYNEGFDDGYWEGYNAGRYYGAPGYNYQHGMTFIRNTTIVSINIFDVRIDIGTGLGWFRTSYNNGWYGPCPGSRDLYQSRSWVESRIGRSLVVSSMVSRRVGNYDVRYANRVNPVPDYYRTIPRSRDSIRRPVPIGSIVRPGAGGRPDIIPPSQNGRGVVVPPRVRDPQGGGYRPLPPRTGNPARPSPGNPVIRPPRPENPGAPRPNLPPYRPGNPVGRPPAPQPGRPVPQPGRPVPQPERPPVVRPPAPQPGRPVPQPGRPVPQPERPPVVRPPAPQPGRPVPQPGRPVPQPERPPVVRPPAPQPDRRPPPVVRPPAPQPDRRPPPVVRPPAPQPRPVPQPDRRPPPVVRPPAPQPDRRPPPVVRPAPSRPQPPAGRPPSPSRPEAPSRPSPRPPR